MFQVPVRLEVEGNITFNASTKVEFELNLNFNSFESRYPDVNAFDISSVCIQEPSKPEKSRLSGAVAGVALVCVVVGLIMGAVVVYFVIKKLLLPRTFRINTINPYTTKELK